MQSIRGLLLAEWDPIGVRGEPAAQDEYDRYLPAILALLQRKASPQEVAKYLNDVATLDMGLVGVEDRDLAVAWRLLALSMH